jgi:hypothetical protein
MRARHHITTIISLGVALILLLNGCVRQTSLTYASQSKAMLTQPRDTVYVAVLDQRKNPWELRVSGARYSIHSLALLLQDSLIAQLQLRDLRAAAFPMEVSSREDLFQKAKEQGIRYVALLEVDDLRLRGYTKRFFGLNLLSTIFSVVVVGLVVVFFVVVILILALSSSNSPGFSSNNKFGRNLFKFKRAALRYHLNIKMRLTLWEDGRIVKEHSLSARENDLRAKQRDLLAYLQSELLLKVRVLTSEGARTIAPLASGALIPFVPASQPQLPLQPTTQPPSSPIQ